MLFLHKYLNIKTFNQNLSNNTNKITSTIRPVPVSARHFHFTHLIKTSRLIAPLQFETELRYIFVSLIHFNSINMSRSPLSPSHSQRTRRCCHDANNARCTLRLNLKTVDLEKIVPVSGGGFWAYMKRGHPDAILDVS